MRNNWRSNLAASVTVLLAVVLIQAAALPLPGAGARDLATVPEQVTSRLSIGGHAQAATTNTPSESPPASHLRPARVELALESIPAASSARALAQVAVLPQDTVALWLDDGGAERLVGVGDGAHSSQFLWLNRFTPLPGEFPLSLDEIRVLFAKTDYSGLRPGDGIDLVVYEDQDKDPGNGATLRGVWHTTVLETDGNTWSVYELPAAVALYGPGHVLIGVINRYAEAGITPPTYPAALDQTTSLKRSWIGWWSTMPPDPPTLPPDEHFALVDDTDSPGNWLIRGYGQTGAPANQPPTLSWTGEPNYTADGLHPETGAIDYDYVYRIRYLDVDGDPPGHVEVHIEKGGSEIAGSPFAMTCESGEPQSGITCSHIQSGLPVGSDYAYYFDAQDSQANAAMPTARLDDPVVMASLERAYLPLLASDPCTGPLYFDDFSDPNSGWASGEDDLRSWGYYAGEYRIRLKVAGTNMGMTPDLVLPADYRLEVDARQASSQPGSYGLVFGIGVQGGQSELYQFIVFANNQEYLLEKKTRDGAWMTLIDWTYDAAIQQGSATNHLRVDRMGTAISLYANGAHLTTHHDGSFTGAGRDAGVRAYSGDAAPVDMRFDNFRVSCAR